MDDGWRTLTPILLLLLPVRNSATNLRCKKLTQWKQNYSCSCLLLHLLDSPPSFTSVPFVLAAASCMGVMITLTTFVSSDDNGARY